MRSRPNETPQQAGRRFERFFAKVFGVEPTPGSGNQWFSKLDVPGGAILWSLKWTKHESISITKALLRECDKAIHEDGNNCIAGIAASIDDGGEVIVAMRWSDLQRILTTGEATMRPSKGEQKRINSRVPSLLRDAEEDA